jgi:hypothetical protein
MQTQIKSSQVHSNEDPDEFYAFEALKDVPLNKEEMIDLLCDYVIAIEGEAALK